jgi:DNA-binding transcriptional LysR family regulator
MSLYASPAYLDEWGTPHHLADLTNHCCLQLRPHNLWIFSQGKERVSHKPGGRFIAGDVESVRMACLSGLGIAYLVRSDMEAAEASGSVKRICLADAKGLDLFVSALMPTRSFVPARVRVFIEALEARLRDPEKRNG